MRLDVTATLSAEGTEFPFTQEVTLPDSVALGEVVTFPAPAVLTGTFVRIGETIRLRGTIAFQAVSRCMLCLSETSKPLTAPFDAVFALAPDPDNPDLYVYDGAAVNTVEMAADATTLALPMQWRCSEHCKGLCPVCGANRNTQSCSCRMDVQPKHPFSALQQLLTGPDGISGEIPLGRDISEFAPQDESEV